MTKTDPNEGQGGLGKATTTKKGPNDASGIVWAPGEFFLLILHVFFSTNRSFIESNNEIHGREGSHDENGPK